MLHGAGSTLFRGVCFGLAIAAAAALRSLAASAALPSPAASARDKLAGGVAIGFDPAANAFAAKRVPITTALIPTAAIFTTAGFSSCVDGDTTSWCNTRKRWQKKRSCDACCSGLGANAGGAANSCGARHCCSPAGA